MIFFIAESFGMFFSGNLSRVLSRMGFAAVYKKISETDQ